MSKQFWKPLLAAPALLSAAVVTATIASATSALAATEATAINSQAPAAANRLDNAASALPVRPLVVADAAAVPTQSVAPTAPPSQLIIYSTEGTVAPNASSQVTSVSQLSDVKPTDWAFQALQSLVERYGCIVGYPDQTFRGNRATTRYEFAAGLNACLDRVNELIAAGTADLVKKEDLAVLQKLQEEFAAELATLRGRVDALEARAATLEKQQFSTTTKLSGEVIFTIADAFGDFPRQGGTNTVFNDRVRLNLLTSFTGKDRLRVRLQAGNATRLLSNGSIPVAANNYQRTNEANLPYDGAAVGDSNNGGNSVSLDVLDYRFPLGSKLTATVFGNGGLHHYYADTVNPFFEGNGGGQNALSRFAERNPIYRIGPLGAGIGINYQFSDNLKIDLGYLSNTASNPGVDGGVFAGNFSALAQLVYSTKSFKLGFTYVRGYERNDLATTANNNFNLGGTGSTFANLNGASLLQRTGLAQPRSFPVESNSFGIEASIRPTPGIVLNGWVGYSDAAIVGLGNAEIWNFAVALGFPNLGKRGNFLGIVAGAEPTLRGTDFSPAELSPAFASRSQDFAYHIEVFYKYQLTDNISITPGLIYLPSVNQNAGIPGVSDNGDVFVGVLRTTFTF